MAALRSLFPWAAALLLCGCATTAMTLMEGGGMRDAVVPSPASLQSELKGRAFEIGTVSTRLPPRESEVELSLTSLANIDLLDDQLRKAFAAAGLEQGSHPAYTVSAVIEVARFTVSGAPWGTSVYQILMQVDRPDGSPVMRGRFVAQSTVTLLPLYIGGVMVFVPLPKPGPAQYDLAQCVPAMAETLARVLQGLRDGLTLDAIAIANGDNPALIRPAAVLKNSTLGMRTMSPQEIHRIIGFDP